MEGNTDGQALQKQQNRQIVSLKEDGYKYCKLKAIDSENRKQKIILKNQQKIPCMKTVLFEIKNPVDTRQRRKRIKLSNK